MPSMSKSQINRLGKRLAAGVTDADRALYAQLRTDHDDTRAQVEAALREALPDVELTSRLKTLDTVVAKLQREKTRLSTMQDIAGCRITVPGLTAQDATVATIQRTFPEVRVDDLRDSPHGGYRAVHCILTVDGRRVEVQVRTTLQDLWGQLSEQFSDVFGLGVKYGRGPVAASEVLQTVSDRIWDQDRTVARLDQIAAAMRWWRPFGLVLRLLRMTPNETIADIRNEVNDTNREIMSVIVDLMNVLESTKMDS